MANKHEYFARCASGFEQVLAQELRELGLSQVRPLKGGVAFFGNLQDGYRACLWSRVATRIQYVLSRVDASTAEALYQGACSFPWEGHVTRGATISVQAHGTNPQLRNTSFTALKVKDALCDRLRDIWGSRPNVDTRHPDFAINVAVHQQRATIYLNLTGESLHRRGYREDGVQTEAPLKETLAAGMLLAAGWSHIAHEGGNLVDPMCGSGTLAIEAALMATGRAPGLLRTSWGFLGWALHDASVWDALVAEAQAAALNPTGKPHILAGDLDKKAVAIARQNARRAGVDKAIGFYVDDASNLGHHLRWMRNSPSPGLLVANPPYGKRLLAREDLPQAYASLSAAVESLPRTWRAALITPDAGIDSSLGRLPSSTLACHNGPIPTWIRQYAKGDERTTSSVTSLSGSTCVVPVALRGSTQLASRLRKVARERTRWAGRNNIACFRLYDADLPEYAFSIDLYADSATRPSKRMALMREHPRHHKVDPQLATQRLADAASIVAAVLDISRKDIVIQAQDGNEPEATPIAAAEGPYTFRLDARHPDALLPLAAREIRTLCAKEAADKRVACLFATTGAAFAYAVGAGARSAVLVDSSSSHLERVRCIIHGSGIPPQLYRTATADPRTWLRQEAKAGRRYDLVICLAPSWLPASGKSKAWDLQADATSLVLAASQVLSSGGSIILASSDTALPGLGKELAAKDLVVADVSNQVLPHDFEQSRNKPSCYVITET